MASASEGIPEYGGFPWADNWSSASCSITSWYPTHSIQNDTEVGAAWKVESDSDLSSPEGASVNAGGGGIEPELCSMHYLLLHEVLRQIGKAVWHFIFRPWICTILMQCQWYIAWSQNPASYRRVLLQSCNRAICFLSRYARIQLALYDKSLIVNSWALHREDLALSVVGYPGVAVALVGRWLVVVPPAILFLRSMLYPKRLKVTGKLLASYNKCRESVSIVLDTCRCRDISPRFRNLLLSYPKTIQKSMEAHRNARKQLYRHLYGILQIKQRDLHSAFTFAYICTLSFVQFGSQKKLGDTCGPYPTFVYPAVLQNIVRRRFSLGMEAYSDPKGDQVCFAVYFCVYLPTSIIIYHMQVYHSAT